MKIELKLDEKLDFEVCLIHTQLPEFRLAFMLNAFLSLNLKRGANKLTYSDKYKDFVPYLEFNYQNTKTKEFFQLIENKSSLNINGLIYDEFLLPNYKKYNYIFIIHQNYSFQNIINLLKSIKEINFMDYSNSNNVKLILN